jgi:hypothetical protein
MKNGLHLLVPCVLFSSQLFSAAESLPRDLSQLKSNYLDVVKEERDTVSIELKEFTEDSSALVNSGVFIERLSDVDKDLLSLKYERVDNQVRDTILTQIFKTNKTPSFCHDLKLKEFKIPEDEELSEDELGKRRERARSSSCRELVKKIFSGIMFADPETYLLSQVSQDRSTELNVYVRSMVDDRHYLNFTLRTNPTK